MMASPQARDLLARAALMVAVYAIFAAMLPTYTSLKGGAALLDGAVLTGLIALGVGLTMIAGEMDLSVGSMAALCGVIAVKLAPAAGPMPAILAVAAFAAGLGALQGLAIAWLRINSMIFTIGTLIGLRGITLIASGETTVLIPFDRLAMTDGFAARFLVFSPLSLTLLAAALAVGLFANRTLWGRELYAIGGGRAEARAAGVSIRRPIVLAFALSAGLAGLGGALLSLRSGSASPLGFEAVLLEAVAACLIGGVALQGGRGSIPGILCGLFALRFLISGIGGMGAPFWAQSLATGALLIIVIVVEALSRAIVARRALARRGASAT